MADRTVFIDTARYAAAWVQSISASAPRAELIENTARVLGMLLGFVLLLSSQSETAFAYDGSKYLSVCNNLVGLVEGGFGAMMTAIAGMGAIIASAMGGFKMAWACVIVSVGAFILRAYMQLFFENCGS